MSEGVAVGALRERHVIQLLEQLQTLDDRVGGQQRGRAFGPHAIVRHAEYFQGEPEVGRRRHQVIGPEAILLLGAVGEGLAHRYKLIRRLGRRDVGVLVPLAVDEEAEGHRHHVQAIQMAVLPEDVVSGAQVRDVVGGQDAVQRSQEVSLEQARGQLGGGHDNVAIELAGLGPDDDFGGVIVERDILGHHRNVFLGVVELLYKGFPGDTAIALFKPPRQVADSLLGAGIDGGGGCRNRSGGRGGGRGWGCRGGGRGRGGRAGRQRGRRSAKARGL